jgi:hypothetical protein
MSKAKIIKIPGGEAFLEVGEDYIRLGVGKDSFIVLDKAALSAGATNVNWQLSPDKMTYHGFLTHINPELGFIPLSPHYSISTAPINTLVTLGINAATIASSVGIP